MSDSSSSPVVGLVLGSQDATPLEFWFGVRGGHHVQLDDLVVTRTTLSDGQTVTFYGIVDIVRKRFEGSQFDTDAFRVADGTLPADVSYAAHVQVTRVEPELFVPPGPGEAVSVVRDEEFRRALYFDRMERSVAIGLTRTGEPVHANLEFLDGTRGAHASISGVSGVATKTSYATFILYSLFHSGALGLDAANAKALIFNVKGEDLLWLDKPNAKLTPETRAEYQRLGLPDGPFQSVAFFAPTRKGSDTPMPDTGSRQEGVQPYVWTLREFCREKLLRFVFMESDDARAQIHLVITRVEHALERAAREGDQTEASLVVNGTQVASFDDLVDLLDSPNLDAMMGNAPVAGGTLDAFRRRLHAAAERMGHLVSGHSQARGRTIDWSAQQVTVVDIHSLHASAQLFVVGVLLKRMMDQKERQGGSRPLVFVVLDELNKYAPREGWSPLHGVLLDIAERGRSLGVSLFGAQQTASEVEGRIVGNASLKVVGRLDAAEAERTEYGFLTRVGRVRATLLRPGSMIVAQPEIPMAILLRFPFPSWATRKDEVAAHAVGPDPFTRMNL
ncbi:MAG TPA: ATP-binding protein [Vicinamibacterales bacterium]|nr:ATP-binding protein [Vicinamibacterales bacterium]